MSSILGHHSSLRVSEITKLKVFVILCLNALLLVTCENYPKISDPRKEEEIRNLNDTAFALRYDATARSLLLADSALRLAQMYHIAKEEIRSCNILSIGYYFTGRADSVKLYAQQALELSKSSDDVNGLAMSLRCLANWYLVTEDYRAAIDHFKQSAETFKICDDKINEAISVYNIGIVFEFTATFDSSMYYYREAARINLLTGNNMELGFNYIGIGEMFQQFAQPDSCIIYLTKALNIFDKLKYELGKANVQLSLTDLYTEQCKYSMAVEKCNDALSYFIKSGNIAKSARCYQRLGIMYKQMGEYSDAVANYEKALRFAHDMKDNYSISTILSNIGNIYFSWNKFDESLKYYQQAIAMEEAAGGQRKMSNFYNNIGLVYFNKKDYALASTYFNKAYADAKKSNEQAELSVALENLGLIEDHKGNPSKALQYFNQSAEIDKQTGNFRGQACGLTDMAKLYLKSDQAKAIQYLNQALSISQSYDLKAISTDITMQLAKMYANQKDYRNSYLYMIRYDSLNALLLQEKSTNSMARFEVKYDTYKKQQTVERLALENKLNIIKVKKERNLKLFFLIGSLLTLFFAIVLFRQFSKLKISYKQLVKKNVELTRKEQSSGVSDLGKIPHAPDAIQNIKSCKYSNSNITAQQAEEILTELETKLKLEKVYLDKDLTLQKLAKLIDTNSTYLSQIINDYYCMNFSNFINEYRIKEACVLLNDDTKSHFTIEWIAQSVGFNSKSVFNTAFKKFTGITPSFYQKTIISENLLV